MKKRDYSRPMTIIIPLQCESICVTNSGATNATIPGMGWGDSNNSNNGSGSTNARIPGMSWEEYEKP
ncbi:MAG: hypothetical protein K6E73_04805 [Bacteroidales bacterium]|nr:hypothetical protein [Bacteroidales bacterium]